MKDCFIAQKQDAFSWETNIHNLEKKKGSTIGGCMTATMLPLNP